MERLESLIADGKRLPLTSNVVVDQAAALELIDQLRVAVPEEIRAAKRINSEGERILVKAQEQAEQTIARAQEQAAFLIEERGLADEARRVGDRIVEEAHAEADEVRRGADEYAASILIGLEGDLVQTLQRIRKGIEMLDERRAALAHGGPDVDAPEGSAVDPDVEDEDQSDAADDDDVDAIEDAEGTGPSSRRW